MPNNTRLSLRERLDSGSASIGAFLPYPNVALIDIVGQVGMDYAFFDLEHTDMSQERILSSVVAAEYAGLEVVFRVPAGVQSRLLPLIEIGVRSFMLPHAGDVATVRNFSELMSFPPNGKRGAWSRSRVSRYGHLSLAEVAETMERSRCLIATIEDRQGVENLEQLLEMPEIDCIIVGHEDLAVSYGHLEAPNKFEAVSDTVYSIIEATRKSGKAVGIGMGPSGADEASTFYSHWKDFGVQLFLIDPLSYVTGACEKVTAAFRDIMSPGPGR